MICIFKRLVSSISSLFSVNSSFTLVNFIVFLMFAFYSFSFSISLCFYRIIFLKVEFCFWIGYQILILGALDCFCFKVDVQRIFYALLIETFEGLFGWIPPTQPYWTNPPFLFMQLLAEFLVLNWFLQVLSLDFLGHGFIHIIFLCR